MAKALVHPTSFVEAGAELADDVVIGPFCTISSKARIGRGTKFLSHVVVMGNVEIGEENTAYPGCVLGGEPQDLTYKGEETVAIIGHRNRFREAVTIHRGTMKDQGVTRIGNDNYFMVGSHVAHDVIMGNNNTFANSVALAGHVQIGNFINIGGLTAILQRCRVGDYAFVGACSVMRRDLPPYMCAKDFSQISGPNLVGLRRAGMSEEDIRVARELYKTLYLGNQTTEKALEEMESRFASSQVGRHFIDFVKETKIGIQR